MQINQAVEGDPFEAGESVEAVEFEIALGTSDLGETSFEDCVRQAAEMIGGELLFAMPADGSIEDAREIAAIRIGDANEGGGRVLFAVLNGEGDAVRVADREEVGDRFHGFARAFVGVLSRIRDEMPSFGRLVPEGTA
ncbi:hypothetical protein [Jiella mangrovi]|uniref:Uncharacterized protein n=1 Tax=Jiella mangrovi TaxID=2821407 RepID=A0ABS4BI07_9HYPH|nr:hypothetical protein [Jiella mangrovi]MBP0616393.1 hypothetical protein [Jiella mangrovi]